MRSSPVGSTSVGLNRSRSQKLDTSLSPVIGYVRIAPGKYPRARSGPQNDIAGHRACPVSRPKRRSCLMHHVGALYPVYHLEYFIYLPISVVLVNLAVLVWLPYGDSKRSS